MLISYIIPTLNRPERLAATLTAIGELRGPSHDAGSAEVIVVDNASTPATAVPERLANGLTVRLIRRPTNDGAAARNIAAQQAHAQWLVMLDDDSHPTSAAFTATLQRVPADVAALGAEIFLPTGHHEAGGLPEVFTGCGVAIRREVYITLGGYDPRFEYYAEEYDLSARLILAGFRIAHSSDFRILHHKIEQGRDMNVILRNLVRNNGWVALRYAPDAARSEALNEAVMRYAEIAGREKAARGYEMGLRQLHQTAEEQPRRAMTQEQWDRFTGVTHARKTLGEHGLVIRGRRVAVVAEGKNSGRVRQVIEELGGRLVDDDSKAETLIVGTLAPGRAVDSLAKVHARAAGRPLLRATEIFDEHATPIPASMIAA